MTSPLKKIGIGIAVAIVVALAVPNLRRDARRALTPTIGEATKLESVADEAMSMKIPEQFPAFTSKIEKRRLPGIPELSLEIHKSVLNERAIGMMCVPFEEDGTTPEARLGLARTCESQDSVPGCLGWRLGSTFLLPIALRCRAQ